MIFRKMIATILVVMCSVTSIACMTTFASENRSDIKVDYELRNKIDTLSDNDEEKIPVSVWFKQDENKNTNLIKAKLLDSLGSDFTDLIEIALNIKSDIKGIDGDVKSREENIEQSKLMQKVIELKRSIESSIVKHNNKVMIQKLNNKLVSFNSSEDLIYTSSFLPNVEMYLTKKDIEVLSLKSDIDYIYCKPELQENLNDKKLSRDEISLQSIYDDYDHPENFGNFLNPTGLGTTRDAFGLYGGNVKIGICDQFYGSRKSVARYFTNSPFGGYQSKNIFSDKAVPRHGDTVSEILAGQYKDDDGKIYYKGIVPYAKLYLASAGDVGENDNYKTAFEYLASQGCSVINMSRSIGSDGYSKYGDTAKWLDDFIVKYNINVVASAGNSSNTGVTSGKMSYNAIIVGSCDKNGKLAQKSSYSNSNSKAFKPDITAYGVNVSVPTVPYGASGTSYAAPMVTGLVAQMCQLSADLRANPTLMKAVVINSSRRKDILNSDDYLSKIGSSSYPVNHKYGIGVMFAPDAYIMVDHYNYFNVGKMNSDENVVELEQKISAMKNNKLVRIVLNVKNNYPTLPLETIKLQVTSPSGDTYISQYKYDTKQVVSIKPGTSGIYKIKLVRLNGTNYNLDYALSYNVISE
mgnify:FL=1